MDFRSAEQIINASLLAGGPPLMVCGPNGIGKTEMIKAEALVNKKTVFTTAIEYGGFKQYERVLKEKKIRNLVLSDLQSITERPPNVRGNVIRILSSLTAEGTQFELTFSRDRPVEDFQKRNKSFNMNVIIGCTPKHLRTLIREGHHDLMVRFAYIFVERNVDTIDFKKPFKLSSPPLLKYDRLKLQQLEATNPITGYGELNPRENMMAMKLRDMLAVMGARPNGKVKFYRPLDSGSNQKDINLDARLVSAPDM